MTLWWLSFASEGRFLGACIVECDGDDVDAARKARETGCNPGGEVVVIRLDRPTPMVLKAPKHKLMSRAEWDAIGVKTRPLLEV